MIEKKPDGGGGDNKNQQVPQVIRMHAVLIVVHLMPRRFPLNRIFFIYRLRL